MRTTVTEAQWWREMNEHGHSNVPIKGGVVFADGVVNPNAWNPNPNSPDGKWSRESRTYTTWSTEKAFGDYGGYSIYAMSLDGSLDRIERWIGNDNFPIEEFFIEY